MAEKTRDELKSYFESGKRPTGTQFADLIDSVLNKQDDAFNIDANDNIGVGTPAAPAAKLHIFNTETDGLLVESDNWPELDLIAASNTNDYRSKITLDPVSGALQFRLGQGAIGVDGSGDNKLVINQNGNLGIGTTTPDAKLELSKNNAPVNLQLSRTGGHSSLDPLGQIDFFEGQYDNAVSSRIEGTRGPGASGRGELSFFTLQTSGETLQERMRITYTGNIGIGTGSPQGKLDVAGAVRYSGPYTGAVLFGHTNESGIPDGDGFRMRYDGDFFGASSDALVFEKTDSNSINPDGGIAFVNTGNDGIEDLALAIRGNGNIGVGIDNPTSKLHMLIDGHGKGIILENQADQAGSYFNFIDHDGKRANIVSFDENYAGAFGNSLQFFARDGKNIQFATSTDQHAGANRLVILNNGNIGIGTTTPDAELELSKGGAPVNLQLSRIGGHSSLDPLGQIDFFEGQYDNAVSSRIEGTRGPGTSGRGELSFSTLQTSGETLQERMRITYTGNVGIGTSSPQGRLDIAGATRYSGPYIGTVLFGNTNESGFPNGDGFRIRYANFFDPAVDTLIFEKTDGNSTTPDGGIAFVNTGNDGIEDLALAIRGNGNIGVGIDNPTRKLHTLINGHGKGIILENQADQAGSYFSFIDHDGKRTDIVSLDDNYGGAFGNSLQFFARDGKNIQFATSTDQNAGSNRLVVLNNGNIGIGTANPDAKLELSKGGAPVNLQLSRIGGHGSLVPLGQIDFFEGQYDNAVSSRIEGTRGPGTSGRGELSFSTLQTSGEALQERMRITYTGNVGIGTNSPAHKLHINSDDNQLLRLTSSIPGTWMDFENTSAASGNRVWSVGHVGSTGNFAIYQRDGTNTYRFSINPQGNIGIGTTAPSAKLSVNGSANKPGGGDWGVFSDRRLKKHIKPFKDGLKLLKAINPVRYRYNGKTGINDDNENVGIIAQEMRELFPYMISTYTARLHKSDNYDTELLSFDGSALKFVMVNAIKEMDSAMDKLRDTIKERDETIKGLHKTNEQQDEINKKLQETIKAHDKRFEKLESQLNNKK